MDLKESPDSRPLLHIFLVNFHHKKGSQVCLDFIDFSSDSFYAILQKYDID